MTKWDDIKEDLLEAFVQAHMPISKEQQLEVIKIMAEKGHILTWNAIRYVRVDFVIWPPVFALGEGGLTCPPSATGASAQFGVATA